MMRLDALNIRIEKAWQPCLKAHVPEPPEHDPSVPPSSPPPGEPDKEIDLPPREEPDRIDDPEPPPPENPPMH